MDVKRYTEGNVKAIDHKLQGIYGIYGNSGTVYVGRSGVCIRTRLLAHIQGRGSKTVDMLRREGYEGELFFSYHLTQRDRYDEAVEIIRTLPIANKRFEKIREDFD